MVLDKIIASFLSGNIPQKKDTMFWITLLIISLSVPLSIYGFITTQEVILLFIGVGLTVGFVVLWVIVFFQEEKWLKLERQKQVQDNQNIQQLFDYVNLGFLLWLSEKKYLPKECGKSIAEKFHDSLMQEKK